MNKQLLTATLVSMACAGAWASEADPAASLRAAHESLEEALQKNQFKQPLVLQSDVTPQRLKGDVYAVVTYPFASVSAALNNPDHWCDIILLHINVKYCRPQTAAGATLLKVNVGKNTQEELADAPRLAFNYRVTSDTPNYLQVQLEANAGPMGTSDYRIMLEAVALPGAHSFLHLTYSYSMGLGSRLAMQTYFGTIGHDKVGFSIIGRDAEGQPTYINGMRGMMERNTMRYYLAIDSYLASANAPFGDRLEKRLLTWFNASERYPRQLHEVERSAYLEMKRAEHARQQIVE
jgi:hypothetical protein